MPVSTVSNGNGREWCKPRGKRDVLSWMFFHPMEPGSSGARAGQSRGDGARTVSTSAPHTHSLFLQCASLHIGAGTREAGWCQETSLVQIISQLEQRGSHRDLGVAIWLLTPLLLPHKSTGAAPQPAAPQPLSSGSSHALRTARGSGQTAQVPGTNWETFREGSFSVPTARGSSSRKMELEIREQAEQPKVWALPFVRAFHLTEHTDTVPIRRESLQRGSLHPSADSPAVPELHLDPP